MAFNLGISLVFALSAVGAYGLVYNLLSVYALQSRVKAVLSGAYKLWLSLLGPVFVLLVSNAGGLSARAAHAWLVLERRSQRRAYLVLLEAGWISSI